MEVHEVLKKPFNEAQLELLKVLAMNLTDVEMKELKKILLAFQFNRISEMADKLLEAKGIFDSESLANEAQKVKENYRALKKQRLAAN